MPFAGYKDFAECVSKNSSKRNPQAYCATIMRATEAELSPAQRKKYAKSGIAMPDGSYPIPNVAYLEKAIKAFGRSPDAATKRHIIKRARALGRTDLLPENWKGSTKDTKEEVPLKKDSQISRSEVLDVTEAEFVRDETTGKMTADIVLIRAGRAKNPRNYRPSALEKAAKEGTYNGLRMFVNHSMQPPIKRGLREMVSAVESTVWDPTIGKLGGIRAHVDVFDKEFFDYAQAAKRYMGVSADHTIGVTRVREGQQLIEDVHEIVAAKSVDWVLYPSAGGEALSFARESEGAEEVEWTDIKLEDLEKNAPQLLEEYKAKIATESEGPEDEPDDDEGDEVALPKTKAELQKLVQEQVNEIQTAAEARARKQADVAKQVKGYVEKAGLPPRTQARVIASFDGVTEYKETDVKEAVDTAKAELKEAGAHGPKITGMGASTTEEGETQIPVHVGARESVESFFMGPKKAPKKTDDDKKE